jgi:hypothetical protein
MFLALERCVAFKKAFIDYSLSIGIVADPSTINHDLAAAYSTSVQHLRALSSIHIEASPGVPVQEDGEDDPYPLFGTSSCPYPRYHYHVMDLSSIGVSIGHDLLHSDETSELSIAESDETSDVVSFEQEDPEAESSDVEEWALGNRSVARYTTSAIKRSFGPATKPEKLKSAFFGDLQRDFIGEGWPIDTHERSWLRVKAHEAARLDGIAHNQDPNLPSPYRRSVARTSGWSTELYEYEPLDQNEESLRLIRLLPTLSKDGLLQCVMVHATIETEYTCLSYVWGKESVKRKHEILINGRFYNVQPNLWSFLWIAGLKYSKTYFWIDALSIAQHNIEERNHQVRQMGRIYSHAQNVVAWLGNDSTIAAFLAVVKDFHTSDAEHVSHRYWKTRYLEVSDGYDRIFRHEYWTRAWITQEVILAQGHLTFMAGEAEVRREEMDKFMVFTDLRPMGDFWTQFATEKEHSLLILLHTFQLQKCTVERDKVYSLLSLCDQETFLEVDYDTSELTFVEQVLRSCAGAACLCSSTLLAAALCVWTPALSLTPQIVRPPLLQVEAQARQTGYRRDPGHLSTDRTSMSIFDVPRHICDRCAKDLHIHPEMNCQSVVCLADICSVNEGHLIYYSGPEGGDLSLIHFLPYAGNNSFYGSQVTGGIYERDRKTNGSFTLGFTLEALLSQSWTCHKDHDTLPHEHLSNTRYELCERAKRNQTLFQFCEAL